VCFTLLISSAVAGARLPVVEGQVSTIEVPKGTSDLGLGISWCETQVRSIDYTVAVSWWMLYQCVV